MLHDKSISIHCIEREAALRSVFNKSDGYHLQQVANHCVSKETSSPWCSASITTP